jgi:hypothetical protein
MKKVIIVIIIVIILIIIFKTDILKTEIKETFINDLPAYVGAPVRYVSYDLRCVPGITKKMENIIYNRNELDGFTSRKKCLSNKKCIN